MSDEQIPRSVDVRRRPSRAPHPTWLALDHTRQDSVEQVERESSVRYDKLDSQTSRHGSDTNWWRRTDDELWLPHWCKRSLPECH